MPPGCIFSAARSASSDSTLVLTVYVACASQPRHVLSLPARDMPQACLAIGRPQSSRFFYNLHSRVYMRRLLSPTPLGPMARFFRVQHPESFRHLPKYTVDHHSNVFTVTRVATLPLGKLTPSLTLACVIHHLNSNSWRPPIWVFHVAPTRHTSPPLAGTCWHPSR